MDRQRPQPWLTRATRPEAMNAPPAETQLGAGRLDPPQLQSKSMPSPGGRSQRWRDAGRRSRWLVGAGYASSPRPPVGLPHGAPGARLAGSAGGWAARVRPGRRAVGRCQVEEMTLVTAVVEINYGRQAAGGHQGAWHAPARPGTAHHDNQARSHPTVSRDTPSPRSHRSTCPRWEGYHPAPAPALARQQRSSRSVASRRHSLTPPGTFSTLRRHAR